jgi:hypothetical protein
VIPAGYVHVVFTLPHALNDLARRHPRIVYEALFGSASETLLTFARDPSHLGARPGITTVLHTWTQRLDLHVHLHCIVTAGGLDLTARRWVKSPRGFLFSVRALSRVFRGKYLDALRRLSSAPIDAKLEAALYRHDWVVYIKAPPAGPAALLTTSRYAPHRERRAHPRIRQPHRSLRWRDSSHRNKRRVLHIDAVGFFRFSNTCCPGLQTRAALWLLAPTAGPSAVHAIATGVVGSPSSAANL